MHVTVSCGGREYECRVDGAAADGWWIVDIDGEEIELAPAAIDALQLAAHLEAWFDQLGSRPQLE